MDAYTSKCVPRDALAQQAGGGVVALQQVLHLLLGLVVQEVEALARGVD